MINTPGTVTAFAARGDGQRHFGVQWDGVSILVQADSEDPEVAATELASMPPRLAALTVRVAELEVECARLREQVSPPKPNALLGLGCVREADGAIYLLNRPDKGLGEWGVRLEGWEDLFRRYDVAVSAPQQDEHGQYWIVAPRAQGKDRR